MCRVFCSFTWSRHFKGAPVYITEIAPGNMREGLDSISQEIVYRTSFPELELIGTRVTRGENWLLQVAQEASLSIDRSNHRRNALYDHRIAGFLDMPSFMITSKRTMKGTLQYFFLLFLFMTVHFVLFALCYVDQFGCIIDLKVCYLKC
ncbi:uncharacterized protein [Rutidosis leptorrhynchoides]|uniref:uncharacterized protein n=1 Tax=Rutidosis leptorrhynchoides TaxID=125765 RepID=UPI003A9A0CBC